MVCCSIANCGNSSTICNFKNSKITFHRFPQDPDMKDKWISATGKRNWFPTKYSRVCSAHFNDDDFMHSAQRRTLHKSAIPTVCIWKFITENSSDDPQLITPKCELRDPCESSTRILECTVHYEDSSDEPQLISVKCEPEDPCESATPILERALQSGNSAEKQIIPITYEPEDADTPMTKRLRRELQTKDKKIAEQRLKIKSLQTKVRRYRKNILTLKEYVKNMDNKQPIAGNQD